MSKPRLLLADDSLTIQKVVSLTFADKGMEVVAFSDGDGAIEHLDELQPDIVLADVHMPGINGYQVCELIRSNEGTKDTPVILLVGSFEPFDPDEAERVGANTYLTKPFTSIAEVVATVERLVAEAVSAREAEAPAGPRPDTSDIDSLYEQSFAETQELPDKESVEYEADVYDDDMIQTSYAEPDLSQSVEETFYAESAEGGFTAAGVELEDPGTGSLIAESFPADALSGGETDEIDFEPIDEPAGADEAEQGSEALPGQAPVVGEATVEQPASTEWATGSAEHPQSSDPFSSVAHEPPTVEYVPPPAAETNLDDSDLLELPGAPPVRAAQYAVPRASARNDADVVSLSPELIDMIVEKVLERLAEKDRSAEARSVSGT